jgi:hypothetical protein
VQRLNALDRGHRETQDQVRHQHHARTCQGRKHHDLLAQGLEAKQIVIAGDSAGGNLALVAMLAAKMALEIVEVDPSMIPVLDAKAERALYIAQAEERDNSPMMIAPNISMYTQ